MVKVGEHDMEHSLSGRTWLSTGNMVKDRGPHLELWSQSDNMVRFGDMV